MSDCKDKRTPTLGDGTDTDGKIVLSAGSIEAEYEGYIETYYANGVETDEALVLRHGIMWLKKHYDNYSQTVTILEIGNGGTIHHLIPFAKLAQKFVVEDIRRSACERVRRWKCSNDDGGIWRPFVEFVVKEELGSKHIAQSLIDRRIAELREKIVEECLGDLCTTNPLRVIRSFPIVLCYYTAEVAAKNSIMEWKKVMNNLSSLVTDLPGPDHKASLEPHEFKEMVNQIRTVEIALGNKEKKPSASEVANIPATRRSLVAVKPIKRGELLTEENIGIKRPGTGISPMKYWSIIGEQAKDNYECDDLIR